ncbi:hypothetical protein OB905_00120 [Halobacteria archaeon AArc-dxtr1]|nr:hypothetical protein [Halobacteria archaeon AArc-dxtr1]
MGPLEGVSELAVPAAEQSAAVQEAIETGSVTVYGEDVAAFEQSEVIEHEGTYYFNYRVQGAGSHWTGDGGLEQARGMLFALGAGLVAAAGWHFRRLLG